MKKQIKDYLKHLKEFWLIYLIGGCFMLAMFSSILYLNSILNNLTI